ncbi:MAG TPA: FtsX-like permease family protein [Polyangiaceae bacterium]|nr:FtsX-like permease family protein [Polyangiaceae bacterium]
MDFFPILAALRRHRTAAVLIILEIAFTCAMVSNAVFLISERLRRMDRASGIAERELVRIQVTGPGRQENAQAVTQEDLARLSGIPGVRSAASSRQLPFGNSSWNSGLTVAPDQLHASLNASNYVGSETLFETLGVRLVAGRDFTRDEYIDEEAALQSTATLPIIVTRAVSERLWPGENGLGRIVYMGPGHPLRIVGVLEQLVRPNELRGIGDFELSVVLPVREKYKPNDNYVLRVDPERRAEVLAAAVAALGHSRHNRLILKQQTLEEMKNEYYRADRGMAWLLVSVCAALLIITALGIVGLASFWVQQRTRPIGIRRALGATRGQILRYFQAENFLLATMGIALGMLLAYGINQLLMQRYELGRLPAQYLPIGALSLWILGQLAVLGPALRAASVPPAVATRTV